MRECQPLNLHEPTNAERRMPGKTYTTYLGTGRAALCSLDDVKGRAQPHDETYTRLRSVHSVASQLLIEANRDRAASLNIALRAAQTANMQSALNSGQFPEGNASVRMY